MDIVVGTDIKSPQDTLEIPGGHLLPSPLYFCLTASCDCVPLQECNPVFRCALVDHPSGYSCWNLDARSISVSTMEGKS